MKKIGVLISIIAFVCSFNAGAQTVMTIAGTGFGGFSGDSGTAISAEIYGPYGVAVDGAGNKYFVDQLNQRVRKIDVNGIITTIAGTGTAGYSGDSGLAVNAAVSSPWGLATDSSGNIYIADYGNNRIRKINSSGIITTIAGIGVAGYSGDGGPADSAKLNSPSGITIDNMGNIYIADRSNQRIRKINTAGIISTIAGTGTAGYNGDNFPSAKLASLYNPTSIATDNAGNVYIADEYNQRIRKVDTFDKITTIFGTGVMGFTPDGVLAVHSTLNYPNSIATDSAGNLYISDQQDFRIRKMVAGSTEVVTIAGNGISGYNGDSASALSTEIGLCYGVAVDPSGNVYFSDWSNNRVNHVTSTLSTVLVNQYISGVSIYPNPSRGSFTVNVAASNNEQADLVITNMLGETVYKTNIATNKPRVININVAAGVYFLTATTPNGKWSGKLEVSVQ